MDIMYRKYTGNSGFVKNENPYMFEHFFLQISSTNLRFTQRFWSFQDRSTISGGK